MPPKVSPDHRAVPPQQPSEHAGDGAASKHLASPPPPEGDGVASAQDLPPELARFEERLVERVAQTVRAEVARASASASGPAEPSPLWDVRAVARRLGVSARTVETLIATGDLVPLRIGGQRRFDPRAVEAYVKRCAAASAGPTSSAAPAAPPATRRARRG